MKWKTVDYNVHIIVTVNMPADEDPTDIFVDMDYEFFVPRGAEVTDTDIYDESHQVTGVWDDADDELYP